MECLVADSNGFRIVAVCDEVFDDFGGSVDSGAVVCPMFCDVVDLAEVCEVEFGELAVCESVD